MLGEEFAILPCTLLRTATSVDKTRQLSCAMILVTTRTYPVHAVEDDQHFGARFDLALPEQIGVNAMRTYTVAFDVGGLFIKAAVLDSRGQTVPGTYTIYPSRSKESKEAILSHLIDLIKRQVGQIMDRNFRIEGIGFAFPGPFDYERGVSWIREVDKFESLYGVNIREELTRRLDKESFFANKRAVPFRIVFENDTSLFALGEYRSGKARPYRKSICITIGTGTGSAFLENGELIKHRDDVPPNGWVYREPFRGSIVDEHISKRGIMRLAEEAGIDVSGGDVKNLADMAKSGHEPAARIFRIFGERIGEMLLPYIRSFRPDAIVIGGQITGSKELFLGGLHDALRDDPAVIEVTNDTSLSTFTGVSLLLERSKI
jgi:glucokinase